MRWQLVDINKKVIYLALVSLTACTTLPHTVTTTSEITPVEIKKTAFTKAIHDLGLMYKIYGKKELRIMPTSVLDNTGASPATKAEIPNDVTHMMKSNLNSLGGGIILIPYDPILMSRLGSQGYSKWKGKLLPYLIIDGGITEFDRSLISDGDKEDIDLEVGEWGIDWGQASKSALSRIAVDFNLIDFKTFSGVPYMSVSNLIEVDKSLGEKNVGATLYGFNFGLKGTIKKIQGRHDAVRVLLQYSTIQLIGKYANLPYWRLLPNTNEDEIVNELLEDKFNKLSSTQQISKIQEFLYMNGKSVDITGKFDSPTQKALTEFQSKNNLKASSIINSETFMPIYYSVPITKESKYRRIELDSLLEKKPYLLASLDNSITRDISRSILSDSSRSISFDDKPDPLEITPQKNILAPLGKINLSTNKTHYKIGEKLHISFSVDTPMFVTIVTINTNGKKAILFPNPYQPDGYVKPFENNQIPPQNTKGSITIGGPTGTDKIYAFASHQQISPSRLRIKNGEIDEVHLKTSRVDKSIPSQTKKYVKTMIEIEIEK